MGINEIAKKTFETLLEDILLEVKKVRSITKGLDVYTHINSGKNITGIVGRKDSLFARTIMVRANMHKNEGVFVFVYEPKVYDSVERLAEKYEGKFTEICVHKEYPK